MSIPALTPENFPTYVKAVTNEHPELSHIVAELGMPESFRGEASFAGIVRIILAQQVASQAADAALQRLKQVMGDIRVEKVLAEPILLETARLTRQKRAYITNVAHAIASGTLDLEILAESSDEIVREQLTSIKGLGPWSAEIYLMSCLGRLDIFPAGDLALRKALFHVQKLETEPNITQTKIHAARYAPYRTVAARLLWHWYVNQ